MKVVVYKNANPELAIKMDTIAFIAFIVEVI